MEAVSCFYQVFYFMFPFRKPDFVAYRIEMKHICSLRQRNLYLTFESNLRISSFDVSSLDRNSLLYIMLLVIND